MDQSAQELLALRKAAAWSLVAGVAHLVATEFAPGFYPSWYFATNAAAYGLMLPVIASLHVRHEPVRRSGATLGTIAGTSVVVLGLAATANPDLIAAALFIRGVWWWTIGKLWSETGVLQPAFGWATMLLAIASFVLVGAYAAMGTPMSQADLPVRLILAAWLVLLAAFIWPRRPVA